MNNFDICFKRPQCYLFILTFFVRMLNNFLCRMYIPYDVFEDLHKLLI